MTIRKITDTYFVSPQIEAADCAQIAALGIKTVICNRPDAEVPPSHQANTLRQAVEAAGMTFCELPITHQSLTPDNIARHRGFIDGNEGPALAYCASGTRSTIIWALGQAGEIPSDELIAAAASAGYDISNLAPALQSRS